MKFLKKLICIVIVSMALGSCADKVLEPEVYSSTTPENLFNSVEGLESVLFSGYAWHANNRGNRAGQVLASSEIMTDVALFKNHQNFSPYQEFNVPPGGGSFGFLWQYPYRAIRDVNSILDNIDSAPIDDSIKEQLISEAKFVRALSYYRLYYRYGPVPLRTSNEQEVEISRATEDEIRTFIETELISSIPGLPEKGSEEFGRAHKEAAIGMLAKFYLNTKQWQKAADRAKEVMDIGKFSLYPDYFELFQPSNDGNQEVIWQKYNIAHPNRRASLSIMNWIYPINYFKNPRTGHTFCSSCRNFGEHLALRDAFYNSFSETDERKSLIITEYINFDGDTLSLLNNDDTRPFKYWPDADYVEGPGYGNDVPVLRYADILLTRAEALNELNGPNQESINLINQVRNRAGLDDLDLADFASKQELRDKILEERGKEFYLEGKRRNDLIRHGKFIEFAHNRGVLNVQETDRLFPIPQTAIDANPNLEQNPGY